MKQVYILSKRRFDDLMKGKLIFDANVEEYKKTAIISINSPNELEGDMEPWFKEDKSNVLRLFFDDVEESFLHKGKMIVPMSIEQGIQVIKFFEDNKDKESLIVHCAAGVSRSGAVGTFAAEYFNIDMDSFRATNRFISPNAKVMTILRNLHQPHQ